MTSLEIMEELRFKPRGVVYVCYRKERIYGMDYVWRNYIKNVIKIRNDWYVWDELKKPDNKWHEVGWNDLDFLWTMPSITADWTYEPLYLSRLEMIK